MRDRLIPPKYGFHFCLYLTIFIFLPAKKLYFHLIMGFIVHDTYKRCMQSTSLYIENGNEFNWVVLWSVSSMDNVCQCCDECMDIQATHISAFAAHDSASRLWYRWEWDLMKMFLMQLMCEMTWVMYPTNIMVFVHVLKTFAVHYLSLPLSYSIPPLPISHCLSAWFSASLSLFQLSLSFSHSLSPCLLPTPFSLSLLPVYLTVYLYLNYLFLSHCPDICPLFHIFLLSSVSQLIEWTILLWCILYQ